MSITQSGNRTHDATCNTAEMSRQVADDKAKATYLAGGTQAAYDAALKANAVSFYRALVASGVSAGIPVGVFKQALVELGTGEA